MLSVPEDQTMLFLPGPLSSETSSQPFPRVIPHGPQGEVEKDGVASFPRSLRTSHPSLGMCLRCYSCSSDSLTRLLQDTASPSPRPRFLWSPSSIQRHPAVCRAVCRALRTQTQVNQCVLCARNTHGGLMESGQGKRSLRPRTLNSEWEMCPDLNGCHL